MNDCKCVQDQNYTGEGPNTSQIAWIAEAIEQMSRMIENLEK